MVALLIGKICDRAGRRDFNVGKFITYLHTLPEDYRVHVEPFPGISPAATTEAQSAKNKGGAPAKWDWERAKAKAFSHFVANGFAPSDAPPEAATRQIAKWLVRWLTENALEEGASPRESDPNTKKCAGEVYEMYRRDIDDGSSRLK